MSRKLQILVLALATAMACSSEREAQQTEEEAAVSQPASQPGGPPAVTGDTIATASGLQYIVLGSGDGAVSGSAAAYGWSSDRRRQAAHPLGDCAAGGANAIVIEAAR